MTSKTFQPGDKVEFYRDGERGTVSAISTNLGGTLWVRWNDDGETTNVLADCVSRIDEWPEVIGQYQQ